jgi:hypothetical protein
MAITAVGSRHSAAYIAESTYGTTPSTPTFDNIRHTSASLGLSKTTLESGELRDDRQIAHLRHGNKSVAGDIGFELSYTTFDDFLEAALGGTWATDTPSAGIDQLQAGTTRRSFTIERKFANIATPEWHRYTGAEINSFSLSVAPDAMVTGTFNFMAQDFSIGTAAIAGSSYNAATTTDPFDSFSGTITEGGSAIANVTSVELTLENGLSPLFTVGSALTDRPTIGKSRVTGTMTTYFQSKALLDKFINETASSLVFVLQDPAGNTYDFTLPNIKYTGGQPDVSGEGEITIALPFTALYDSTEGSNITIERNPV